MKFAIATLALLQVACSGDQFMFIYLDGGIPNEAATEQDSSDASMADGGPATDSGTTDSDGGDGSINNDSGSDSSVCVQSGTDSCRSVIDAYCTRLAACCNQQCSYSWANAGGMACRSYFESNVPTMDCTKYGQKKVCSEGTCLADTQAVSCADIICQNQMPCPPKPNPMIISNACTSYWGSL